MSRYTHAMIRCFALTLLFILTSTGCISSPAAGYDPLATSPTLKVEHLDLAVNDSIRHRQIPIRIYLAAGLTSAPVVIFSHGLGGSREGYGFLGRHWAGRGYAAVFMQHPGSDSSVWRSQPLGRRMAAMSAAASSENFILRVKDVTAVLNEMQKWNTTSATLAGRFDLRRPAMAGHSFGAVTAQAVGGQSFAGTPLLADARIKSVIALSPSGPRNAANPAESFGAVKIPWMLMTGTLDASPIGGQTPQSRLSVFPALPPGDKYQVVLFGAEHSAFSDTALPGDKEPRNPNHHRAVLALSTAFLDTYVRSDAAAKTWLESSGPSTILDPRDQWMKK